MKRASLTAAAILSAALFTFAWTPPASSPDSGTLARFMPHGAVLVLEARDFSSILNDWSESQTKRDWLASENYQAFSNSHLFLRLAEAQQQFASAAGIPPDANFLREAAGSQSAIALYDIGDLQFLYVAQIQSSAAMRSALWQSRAKFEPRSAGGADFYVRTDASSGRVVAFALANDYLLLATREDLLAGALQSMSGSKDPKLSDEKWFSSAIASAGKPGDLRMVLNLPALTKSPHFRSYWIGGNISELREYSAAISDIHRENGAFREERVMLRDPDSDTRASGNLDTTEGERATAELTAAAPKDAGIYRIVANPSPTGVAAAISRKLFHTLNSEGRSTLKAPEVSLTDGIEGSADDMETQIDTPVTLEAKTMTPATGLMRIIQGAGVNAMMEIQSSELDSASGFVRLHSAVVISASRNWEADAVEEALQVEAEDISSERLGIQWKYAARATNEEFSLDGEFPISFAIRGKYLLISDSLPFLDKIPVMGSGVAEASAAEFSAGVNYRRESSGFAALAQALDGGNFDAAPRTAAPTEFADELPLKSQTGFLAGNVRSLSQTLRVISSEKVVRRESKGKVFETVTYGIER